MRYELQKNARESAEYHGEPNLNRSNGPAAIAPLVPRPGKPAAAAVADRCLGNRMGGTMLALHRGNLPAVEQLPPRHGSPPTEVMLALCLDRNIANRERQIREAPRRWTPLTRSRAQRRLRRSFTIWERLRDPQRSKGHDEKRPKGYRCSNFQPHHSSERGNPRYETRS